MNRAEATAALLRIITEDRDAKCAALREKAHTEANTMLCAAHAGARKRVRGALEEARKLGAERMARAEAQRRTRLRLARQRDLAALLVLAWDRMSEALRSAWRDPGERAQWAERCAQRACAVLPAGTLRIAHPPAWATGERERLRSLLEERGHAACDFGEDPAIQAGLRISSGSVVLDATAAGLLSDRTGVEARLMFHLEGGKG